MKEKQTALIHIEPIIATFSSISTTPRHTETETEARLKDLENIMYDVLKQLQYHYDFRSKTSEECLGNIYFLINSKLKNFSRV